MRQWRDTEAECGKGRRGAGVYRVAHTARHDVRLHAVAADVDIVAMMGVAVALGRAAGSNESPTTEEEEAKSGARPGGVRRRELRRTAEAKRRSGVRQSRDTEAEPGRGIKRRGATDPPRPAGETRSGRPGAERSGRGGAASIREGRQNPYDWGEGRRDSTKSITLPSRLVPLSWSISWMPVGLVTFTSVRKSPMMSSPTK